MLILVHQCELAAKPKNPHRKFECSAIVKLYQAILAAVNKGDVVDTTAPKILGAWLVENPDKRRIWKLTKPRDRSSIWRLFLTQKEGRPSFLTPPVALLFLSGRCVVVCLARGGVFDPEEVAVGHFSNRTMQRCFVIDG